MMLLTEHPKIVPIFGGRVMTLPYNVYFETPMGDINKGEKEIWAS